MSEDSAGKQRRARRRLSRSLLDVVVLSGIIYVLQRVIFLPSVALWWRLVLVGVPVVSAYLGALFLLRLMDRDLPRVLHVDRSTDRDA
jgi:hypothetical protein